MSLYLFYTMVQKSQKWPKTQIKGGPALNSIRTVLNGKVRNFSTTKISSFTVSRKGDVVAPCTIYCALDSMCHARDDLTNALLITCCIMNKRSLVVWPSLRILQPGQERSKKKKKKKNEPERRARQGSRWELQSGWSCAGCQRCAHPWAACSRRTCASSSSDLASRSRPSPAPCDRSRRATCQLKDTCAHACMHTHRALIRCIHLLVWKKIASKTPHQPEYN